MILIGTDEGIYRWFDGCGWPIYHSLQDRAIVSLAAPGAGVMAALDREGNVLESDNNGQDWQVVPGPGTAESGDSRPMEGRPAPTMLALWGEPEMIVLATTPPGFFRRVVGAPLRVPASAARGSGRATAWVGRARTLAEGATALLVPRRRTAAAESAPAPVWTAISTPASASGGRVLAMAEGGGMPAPGFIAIQGAGLWRSLDEGATWQQCPGLPADVLAIRTVAAKPGTVVVATADGCRVSSDNGQTWEDRSGGLENARYIASIEVKPDNPEILLAGAAPRAPDAAGAAPAEGLRFALYESNNGGKSWAQVKRGFPEDIRHDVVTDIRYDPAAPENVVVALSSGELWLSRFDRAYWCPLARQTKAARVLCATA
jgi:photosystem II stability/assembly factor-like uncharacterized protein